MSILSVTRPKPTKKEKQYISERTISPFGVPSDFTTLTKICCNRNETLREENSLKSYGELTIKEEHYTESSISSANTENIKVKVDIS